MFSNFIISMMSCQTNTVQSNVIGQTSNKISLLGKKLDESDYGTSALDKARIVSKDISNKQQNHNLYVESRIPFECDGKKQVLKIRHKRYPIR